MNSASFNNPDVENQLTLGLLDQDRLPDSSAPQPTQAHQAIAATIFRHSIPCFQNITMYEQADIESTNHSTVAITIDSNIDISITKEKIRSITKAALANITLFSLFNVVTNWFSLLEVLPQPFAITLGILGTGATPICCTASKAITLLEVRTVLTAKQRIFFDDIRPKLKAFINRLKKLPPTNRQAVVNYALPVIHISKDNYLKLIQNDPESWRQYLFAKEISAEETFEYALEILVRELSEEYPLKLIICIGQGPNAKLWQFIHNPRLAIDEISLTAQELTTPIQFIVHNRSWAFSGPQEPKLLLPRNVSRPVNSSLLNCAVSGRAIKESFLKSASFFVMEAIPFIGLRLIPYAITILQAGQSTIKIYSLIKRWLGHGDTSIEEETAVFFFSMLSLGWPKAKVNDPFKGVPAVDKLEDLSHSLKEWVCNGRPVQPQWTRKTFCLMLFTSIASAGPIAAVIVYYAGLGLFFSGSGLVTLCKSLSIPTDSDAAKTMLNTISDMCAFSFASQAILTQCFDTWGQFYGLTSKWLKTSEEGPTENTNNNILSRFISSCTFFKDLIVLSFIIDSVLFGVNAAFGTGVMGNRINMAIHAVRIAMYISGACVGISAVLFSIARYEKTEKLLKEFVDSFDMKSTCTECCSFWPCIEKSALAELENEEPMTNVIRNHDNSRSLFY